jgi:hypothetical protein
MYLNFFYKDGNNPKKVAIIKKIEQYNTISGGSL